MIHKVEQLVSIGKFRNYQATGDVSFKKLTLFYGDNGSGKTTLTAVFRSLTQGKPEMVVKRISTNHTSPQAAQIIQRDAAGNDIHHTFRPTGWSTQFPDIEIFDIHFVNENIYSGFDFNDEHKKQLHEFVIGAQGVAIQQQIKQNKIDKSASRQAQTNLETQIIQQVGNDLTQDAITAFLNIPADTAINIDHHISTTETTLANAKAKAVIQILQSLTQLNRINSGIDFEATIIDLQITTQAIQNAALQTMFKNHCNDLTDHSIEGPENWLRIGFNYLQRKQKKAQDGIHVVLACPFCKQLVNDQLDIIKAYSLRFNDDFNALVERLQTYLTSLQSFNLDANIQALNNTNQTNTDRVTSWTTHLPATAQIPVYNVLPDEATLRAEFQALIAVVNQKIQNPSLAVSTDAATTFQASLQIINNNIATYNQSVTAYNATITTFRAGIQTEQQAEAEVNRLKRIKKRVVPAIAALCIQLTAERQNLRTLETAYTQLVQQQQTAVVTFFSNYKDRINHYLGTVFKTPLRIDNVVHVPPQGRATQSKIGYKLTIDGHDISFDSNQPISAKDCLSEGDKSTIALGFFLAKMDIDPGKRNKILIFDDPLSSFDSNRRLYTVQLIKDLLPHVKQLVVLSHNEIFLYALSKDIARGDKKTLRISENLITKTSMIEPLDLDSLVEIDYFKHIKELEDFLHNLDIGKKERVVGLMRNVLEAHIRFKFYRQTSGIPENRRTFGNLINKLVDQNVVFRDHANQGTIISKLRLINDISCKSHHGEPVPDYSALGVDPNTMTVIELSHFVQDTLDLIDNKL